MTSPRTGHWKRPRPSSAISLSLRVGARSVGRSGAAGLIGGGVDGVGREGVGVGVGVTTGGRVGAGVGRTGSGRGRTGSGCGRTGSGRGSGWNGSGSGAGRTGSGRGRGGGV